MGSSSRDEIVAETFDHGEHGTGRLYVFTGVIVERSEMKAAAR
jgi:hypothetical protein